MSQIIELNHVSKRFGTTIALDNISYTVESGTVFALLGENGVGKTTTIRILLGLTQPDYGFARVLGVDSSREDLNIRRSVGYVPEQPILYDWMTVGEIGRFTASFYPKGFLDEYNSHLRAYELSPGVKIKTLSKGMRAKVSLALALSSNPELLILDEPTSGLDPLVRRDFLESMIDRAATGRTVFLSSHQMNEVERVADTVAIMKKGKIVVVESLSRLKETTSLVRLILNNETEKFQLNDLSGLGEQQVISSRMTGREVQLMVRSLSPQTQQWLQNNETITRMEIKTPSLEEIFIAWMGKESLCSAQ